MSNSSYEKLLVPNWFNISRELTHLSPHSAAAGKFLSHNFDLFKKNHKGLDSYCDPYTKLFNTLFMFLADFCWARIFLYKKDKKSCFTS